MIIGDLVGLGQEFGRLAAADATHLLLVDQGNAILQATRPSLLQAGASSVGTLAEDISQPQAEARIYEGWLMQSLLQQPPFHLSRLVNILAFPAWSPLEADPWASPGPEPPYHLPTLLGVNRWFAQEMARQGGGQILNVLTRPLATQGPVQDMFAHTQALLLDFAHHFNQCLPPQVSISTLSVSGESLLIQGNLLPSQLAYDFTPAVSSSRDIATYGYQMLQSPPGLT